MNPSDNLNKLITVLSQLEDLTLEKEKGIYYDTEKNEVKAFESRWFITSFKERSENAYTADAFRKINDLFDKSMQEVKQALQNPSLSKNEREGLVARAKNVQEQLKKSRGLEKLETLRKVTLKRNNREATLAINTLIHKSQGMEQTFASFLNIFNNINATFGSLTGDDILTTPANRILYSDKTNKFILSRKNISEAEMKKQIEKSISMLESNLNQVQEYIVKDLSPFHNLTADATASPYTILKEIKKQDRNLTVKNDGAAERLENIKQCAIKLKEMESNFIEAAPGFEHLLSTLPSNAQHAYRQSFKNLTNRLINDLRGWTEILKEYETAITTKPLTDQPPPPRPTSTPPHLSPSLFPKQPPPPLPPKRNSGT